VERARPELRRLLRRDVPLDRARGLREAFFTGGVPPVDHHVDDVYRLTYGRVRERCRRYYARYPEDRDRVRAVVARLEADDVRLPSGDRLTARRFRQLGSLLGMSDGAEALHYIVERDVDSPGFLHDVEHATSFGRTRCTRSCTRRATRTAASRTGRHSASCRTSTRTRPC
jgi:hypothetical protein